MKLLKKISVMTLGLLVFLILTLLLPYITFKFSNQNIKATNKKSNIVVISHRGASGYAPENTMSAFTKSLDIGADVIELDVHLTKDNEIVVIHDNLIDRTTNGEGEVSTLTLSEIQSFNAGSWFDPKFSNETVPTLGQVLKMVNGRCNVLIELKWPKRGVYNGLVDKVVQEIIKNNAEDWVTLQSFEVSYLKEIEQKYAKIPFEQLVFGESNILPIYFDRVLKIGNFKPVSGAVSVNFFYYYLSQNFVERCKKEKKKIVVFTVNNEKDILKVISQDVDGIITNYPDLALKALGR